MMIQATNFLIASAEEMDLLFRRCALGLLGVTLLLYCVLPRRRYNLTAVILTGVWAMLCAGGWALGLLDYSLNPPQRYVDPLGNAVEWAAIGAAAIWGSNAWSRALRRGATLDDVSSPGGVESPRVTMTNIDRAIPPADQRP